MAATVQGVAVLRDQEVAVVQDLEEVHLLQQQLQEVSFGIKFVLKFFYDVYIIQIIAIFGIFSIHLSTFLLCVCSVHIFLYCPFIRFSLIIIFCIYPIFISYLYFYCFVAVLPGCKKKKTKPRTLLNGILKDMQYMFLSYKDINK